MKTWTKIFYKDGWFPKGDTCILTNAEADGRWKGQKFAIFDLDEVPHVAFWPSSPIVLKEEPVSKKEAERIWMKTLNAHVLWEDYRKTYEREEELKTTIDEAIADEKLEETIRFINGQPFVAIETDELPF